MTYSLNHLRLNFVSIWVIFIDAYLIYYDTVLETHSNKVSGIVMEDFDTVYFFTKRNIDKFVSFHLFQQLLLPSNFTSRLHSLLFYFCDPGFSNFLFTCRIFIPTTTLVAEYIYQFLAFQVQN